MDFWKWYLKGILQVLRYLFSHRALRAIISPLGEYTLGAFILLLASILLGTLVSPLWLILTVPAGITIAMHGLWREGK